MTLKIGITGFGRIGRLVARIVMQPENEWSYSCQVVDLMRFMSRKEGSI